MSTGKTLHRDYKDVRGQTPRPDSFGAAMGLLAGLAIGLAVALGVYLHFQNRLAEVPVPVAQTPPASAQAPEDTPAPVDSQQTYDFYEMLPKQEVEVPQSAVRAAAPASILPSGDVTLQAGSFKQPAEADKLQARLAQYGVDAKIQRFSLDDETFYRVRIGPIATVEELESIEARLAEAEIEAARVTSQSIDSRP